MKVKKVFAMLLALSLVIGLMPGTAFAAEDDDFTIVNTEQELANALKEKTEKVKLGKDISAKSNLIITKKLVLDLNGHTLANPGYDGGDGILNVKDEADVTVQNGTLSGDVNVLGGSVTLTKLKLGMVNCNGGKLVSMENCTITGGNGVNYPQGVYIRKDGAVGSIKNCTITITGEVKPLALAVEGGSVENIEGCTITVTGKGTEDIFDAVMIYGGSVGTIKDCIITANGKNYCSGISVYDGSIKSIENCTITVKNTTNDTTNDGISISGDDTTVEAVKKCTIAARTAISNYATIGEISGCTLNGEYDCISANGGFIGFVLSNTMTATGTYGRGMEVSGSVGTVAYNNVVKAPGAFIIVHDGGKVEGINSNAGDSDIWLNEGGEVGTIFDNALSGVGVSKSATVELLSRNLFSGGSDAIFNEGTIKKTDTSSPVDGMDKGAWYYKAMDYAYANGLSIGIPDDGFKPGDKLSRAMLTQMLWNLERKSASANAEFPDVDSNTWYWNSVNWAADQKIVNGYTNGLFGPNDSITREQVATILYRYAKDNGYDISKKADLSGYTDASQISAYALEAMQWANAEELIMGKTTTTLSPKGNTTCAEMATILMRFVEE